VTFQEILGTLEEHGIEIVPGYCPFMFLPNARQTDVGLAAMFHCLHGWSENDRTSIKE
jgi:hypothetical protein